MVVVVVGFSSSLSSEDELLLVFAAAAAAAAPLGVLDFAADDDEDEEEDDDVEAVALWSGEPAFAAAAAVGLLGSFLPPPPPLPPLPLLVGEAAFAPPPLVFSLSSVSTGVEYLSDDEQQPMHSLSLTLALHGMLARLPCLPVPTVLPAPRLPASSNQSQLNQPPLGRTLSRPFSGTIEAGARNPRAYLERGEEKKTKLNNPVQLTFSFPFPPFPLCISAEPLNGGNLWRSPFLWRWVAWVERKGEGACLTLKTPRWRRKTTRSKKTSRYRWRLFPSLNLLRPSEGLDHMGDAAA